jgi:Fe-S-cluster-containing hydrogenase component 2
MVLKVVRKKILMIFQNCMDLEEALLGSCSETCPTSHDENQVSSMKAERILDIKEEDVPVPVTIEAVDAEYEVSCMSVCPRFSSFQ